MASFITPWALGWVAGTAAQLQQAQLWALPVFMGLGVLALCVLAWGIHVGHRVSTHLRWVAWCVAAFGLAFAQTGVRASWYAAQALDPALEGQTLTVEGMVSHMPQRMDDSVRFRFEVRSAWDSKGQAVNLPPHLLLGWYGPRVGGGDAPLLPDRAPPAEVRAGDRWRLQVRLKAPHGHINPHGFDYELWLWEQGLQATGYVRTAAKDIPPQWLGASWRHPVERARQAARAAIDAQVADRASAGIVAALLVGDQAAIERADWDVFRATGVAHLMAISGLHITGLAWLAALCMGQVWRRSQAWPRHRPWSLWLPTPLAATGFGFGVAWAYALFTGWGVPAQRTVWMLAVVTLLHWHGKRWPWPQVWLGVCTVVLALDPWALLQAGFWLSFVAVGVLFASDARMSEPPDFARQPPDSSRLGASTSHVVRGVWRALRGMWREQWLMSVCLAPLSLLLFHQISLVGVWANLLAVPWVTLVVTPLCLLGLLWAPLWGWAAEALQLLRFVLQGMASLSWAQWSSSAAPVWAGLAALLGMATWALPVPMWLRCYGVVLVLPVLNWHTPRPSLGQFELLSADMGQGHAVLVRTAHHALLYDTGPRYSAETDAGQRVLVPLLRAWGERLDRVIISHQDSDHSGGAAAVLAMQPHAEVLTSVPADHRLQALHPMQRCEHGQSWAWDGVRFNVLHPRAQDYGQGAKPNALSCVLRITTPQGVSALLVGDIEAAQERALVRSGEPLDADWLLVPHHGSATSSTAEFVQAVDPHIAVVQAGYRNRFGHPRADVMARYAEQGVHVVQTTRCGASTWQSAQPEMVRCERETQKRYWHHQF